MKLHDLRPNLHLKTPTLVAVENETLNLSSHCVRITPMVTLLQFTLQEFKSCFLLHYLKPDRYSQVSKEGAWRDTKAPSTRAQSTLLRRQLVAQWPPREAVALPSLAHLLPCSWFNRQEAQPKAPGPSRERFPPSRPCPPPRTASPCARRGRLRGKETL